MEAEPTRMCEKLVGMGEVDLVASNDSDKEALREFVGLWSGWLVVGFMLGGVLGRRSFGGL